MLLICYPKCGTCRKAQKKIKKKGIGYEYRDIKTDNPSEAELAEWIRTSGLPVRKFFNTSGMLYRELQLKDRLPGMTEEEMISLLASDGMLVKRPIALYDGKVLVGFKEAEWASVITE